MKRTALLFFSTCFLIIKTGACQTKYEREYRIEPTLVPERALQFIAALPFKNKIKWYREEGLNSTSLEAKTRHLSKKYSIEFDTLGKVEDIEIVISRKELPEDPRNAITRYLDSVHTRYRLRKIQLQYAGAAEALRALVTKGKTQERHAVNFEIVVKGKTDGRYRLLEYLFSEEGVMLRKARILLRNTDNLEY